MSLPAVLDSVAPNLDERFQEIYFYMFLRLRRLFATVGLGVSGSHDIMALLVPLLVPRQRVGDTCPVRAI